MKASDFNLPADLKFDFQNGITSFKKSRLVILSAKAMGILRENIIKQVGIENARTLIYKFGYQNGFTDFMEMKLNYKFDTPEDLLASGPTMHTWEGIVQATPKDLRINQINDDFYFNGVWKNSWEAEQHLAYHEIGEQPVCWSLMGYAAGWATGFWGKTIVCIEPKCRGKGDENCEWELQAPERWDKKRVKPYLDAILSGQQELATETKSSGI